MTAIEASSVQIRTMADGTLRIVCDVEPRHAQSAFKLFGAPGTPMALAGLKSAKAEPEPERPKGGALSQWAAMRGNEPAFQQWISAEFPNTWEEAAGANDSERVAIVIREVCGIDSRAELDNNAEATVCFHESIMDPWRYHCIATGATA
jgi:hypothetical protein